MSRGLGMVLVLLLASGCALAAPSCGVEGMVGSRVSGGVQRPGGNAVHTSPIADALVQVLDGSGREVAHGYSGQDGHYKIAVPPGTYHVQEAQVQVDGVVVRPDRFTQVPLWQVVSLP